MKEYYIGQKLLYACEEFDGRSAVPCVVTEVYEDHVIAEGNDMCLYIDEDTEWMFQEA